MAPSSWKLSPLVAIENAGVFSKIIAGEIPSYKVYEDEYCLHFSTLIPMLWAILFV